MNGTGLGSSRGSGPQGRMPGVRMLCGHPFKRFYSERREMRWCHRGFIR